MRARRGETIDLLLIADAWLLGALVLLEVLAGWAGHDELEHAHVAWLMSRGLRPYADFFENHLPALWPLLSAFYRLFPGRGPEVLFWGRGLAGLSMIACAFLVQRLGVALRSPRAGWLAADLWLPFSANSRLLQIRPEMPACPLLLCSLWLAFARPAGDRWSFLSGLCSGAAMAFTPRADFFALGVFAAHFQKMSWRQRCSWILGAAAGPLLLVLWMGLPTLLRSVVYVNGHVTRVISVWGGLQLTAGRWLILAAAAAAVLAWLRRSSEPARRVGLVYGLGLVAALLLEGTPFPQMYACLLPLAAVLVSAQVLSWLEDGSPATRRLAWAELLLVWALPAAAEWSGPRAFAHFENSLFWQVRERRLLCERLAGETVVSSPEHHPIGLADATYCWYMLDQLEPMKAVASECHFASEIERNRPALIFIPYLGPMARMDPGAGLEDYVRRNYAPLSKDFLVRKDAAQRLLSERPGS